ncbi:hypothetical protein GDO81_017317 [Engystomops pustulosus]|uniref:Uncharacterized protein n=1 Tax=Engystomops pustulosus TaxID=76066 RepID=A0AAV7AMT4_ENGPU|nr:hypothetical protein GDO81_017317 [Engystomops pustulosus]
MADITDMAVVMDLDFIPAMVSVPHSITDPTGIVAIRRSLWSSQSWSHHGGHHWHH